MGGGGRSSGRAVRSSTRAGGGGMATLKGSEKQIEWATRIRTTVNEALNDSIAHMKEQSEKFGKDAVKEGVDRATRVKKAINSESSSSQLIDTFGGYIGHRTGQDAKQAALNAISTSVMSGVEDLDKKIKKAWNGK